MHPNAERISRFYAAFANRDADAMIACYHPEVEFSDPVFPDLRGVRASAMWRMLCARAKDLRVTVDGVEADDRLGRARWEAWYTFSASGRPVHNIIDAEFEFLDGLILRHHESFDLGSWSRQALGVKGLLLGWSGVVRNRVRQQAAAGLDAYIEKQRIAEERTHHPPRCWMSGHWKPTDYPELSPYVMVAGAQQVIDFLKQVFDGTELRRFDTPDGKVAHAEVRIGESVVMLAEGGPEYPAFPVWLHLYVPDVDVSYRRALDAGAKMVQEPQQKPGDPDRRGGVLDPSGNTWWISSQRLDG